MDDVWKEVPRDAQPPVSLKTRHVRRDVGWDAQGDPCHGGAVEAPRPEQKLHARHGLSQQQGLADGATEFDTTRFGIVQQVQRGGGISDTACWMGACWERVNWWQDSAGGRGHLKRG